MLSIVLLPRVTAQRGAAGPNRWPHCLASRRESGVRQELEIIRTLPGLHGEHFRDVSDEAQTFSLATTVGLPKFSLGDWCSHLDEQMGSEMKRAVLYFRGFLLGDFLHF